MNEAKVEVFNAFGVFMGYYYHKAIKSIPRYYVSAKAANQAVLRAKGLFPDYKFKIKLLQAPPAMALTKPRVRIKKETK